MIISVVAAQKYGISKNVRFLLGHPVHCTYCIVGISRTFWCEFLLQRT